MALEVKLLQTTDEDAWDDYVRSHPHASVYHQTSWGRVVQQTYGHKVYKLMAVNNSEKKNRIAKTSIVGVLPLVHINNFLFGNKLFSQPFADLGGILADSEAVEKNLLAKAAEIAAEQGIPTIELRQVYPLTESVLPPESIFKLEVNDLQGPAKVRMLLNLPNSSEFLMSSFKSKLRSQIRRPLKDGLMAKVGGIELLNDFYTVFAENMRDLGSPVHSKSFFGNLMKNLPACSRIFIVYKDDSPLACSLTLGFGRVLSNPWASSLRSYSRFSPNMLLYWSMLEYACKNGFTIFDFGRSTPDEGTYKFKKQWGAEESPLYWQTVSSQSENEAILTSDKSKFDLAMRMWKHLPVSVSKALGPVIRKNIGL